MVKAWGNRLWKSCAVAAAFTLLFSGCKNEGSGTSAAEHRPIGAGVTISGEKVPERVAARAVDGPRPGIKEATPLAEAIELTPPGALPAPIDVMVPLTTRPAVDSVVLALNAATTAGPWKPIPVQVSGDGRTATVRMEHFSFLSVVGVNLVETASAIHDTLIGEVLGVPEGQLRQPTCAEQAKARAEGYSIDSSAKTALFWCFGMNGNQRILKVVNRKSYPLLVDYGAQLRPIDKEELGWSSAWLAERLAGENRVPLLPAAEVTFALDLKPGEVARLSTEFDGVASSLAQLQLGLETAVTLAVRFGSGAPQWASDHTKALLKAANRSVEIAGCGSGGLDGGWGKLLRDCVIPILDDLGVEPAVLQYMQAIMFWTGIIDFFNSAWDAIKDQITGEDKYGVIVRRVGLEKVNARTFYINDQAYWDGYFFTSPSGRFQCGIRSGYYGTGNYWAGCHGSTSPVPARPSRCPESIGWGHGMEVAEPGASSPQSRYLCASEVIYAPASGKAKVLAYGRSIFAGGFTCVSLTSGVTCKHAATGHGFTIASKTNSLF